MLARLQEMPRQMTARESRGARDEDGHACGTARDARAKTSGGQAIAHQPCARDVRLAAVAGARALPGGARKLGPLGGVVQQPLEGGGKRRRLRRDEQRRLAVEHLRVREQIRSRRWASPT